MATHECTWYNLDMLRKGFSAVLLLFQDRVKKTQAITFVFVKREIPLVCLIMALLT